MSAPPHARPAPRAEPRPPWGRTVPGNRWDLLDGLRAPVRPLVSVIVVHHAQPAELRRTLAGLARQSYPADRLEVLVVDDGSPVAPVVPDGVMLLRQPDRGFRAAAARNLGARLARGSVLCFLDADTVPEPDYVARLTRLPALAPEAVTVGRRRHADLAGLLPGAPVERAAPSVALEDPAWLARGYAETADLLRADDRSYRFLISAVLACSRWFFDRVGGFDETLRSYGGEDWEWGYRAWLAGAVLAHVPDAVAWHDGPDWAGRGGEDAGRRAAKNAETLRLADTVPVAGSRGHGVRPVGADVLVELAAAPSPAAAFVCVDAVLAALPEAVVRVPAEVRDVFAGEPRVLRGAGPDHSRVRVEIVLPGPVRTLGGGLREAVERVAAEGLATLDAVTADGTLLARVRSRRAAARVARWADPGLFGAASERVDWLSPVPDEPDLEAYLGGWG